MKNTVEAFVYKWTETSTNKWYIGSRTAKGCHINDGYICSSKTVKPLVIDNPNNWVREILVIGDPQYIITVETDYLTTLDAKNDKQSYNLHNGDGKFNSTGVEHSDETRAKRSKSLKGHQVSKESIAKGVATRLANGGYVVSEETKQKHRDHIAAYGHPMKDKHHSEESCEKMSKAKKGKSCGELNNFYNKQHSEETKLTISIKAKRKRTCPHCGLIGSISNMTRWHFDNCKKRRKDHE